MFNVSNMYKNRPIQPAPARPHGAGQQGNWLQGLVYPANRSEQKEKEKIYISLIYRTKDTKD